MLIKNPKKTSLKLEDKLHKVFQTQNIIGYIALLLVGDDKDGPFYFNVLIRIFFYRNSIKTYISKLKTKNFKHDHQ